MKKLALRLLAPLLCMVTGAVHAQQIDARFSCSAAGEDKGEAATYADSAEFKLQGDRIQSFRWESSLFRSTHGFDCSIDESDDLVAEVRDEKDRTTWRVALADAGQARERRGYNFDRRLSCTIRLIRAGDTLEVKPSCPALCGSRPNFTQLSVNLKTGKCQYEE